MVRFPKSTKVSSIFIFIIFIVNPLLTVFKGDILNPIFLIFIGLFITFFVWAAGIAIVRLTKWIEDKIK